MSTNGHHHSPLLHVTPLDDHGGLSCTDDATGLRLNLRQTTGDSLEQAFRHQTGGAEAAAKIREVLMGAMEEIGAILHERGIHAVRMPPELEREM